MPLRDLNDLRSDFGGMPLLPVGSSHDRFIYTFTDYYKNDIGRWTSMEHDGVYQSAWPVSRIQSVDPNSYGYIFSEGDDGYPKDQEAETVTVIRRFVVRLLLALNAEPHHLEQSEICTRPCKMKKGGRVRDALWSPNWIGRTYKHAVAVKREPGEEPAWHVRMHWRRGHFRQQHFGKGWSQVKVLWIRPTLVNPAE